MIRVVITGPPTGTGFMPYVIDWWQRGRHHFVGLSRHPLFDACRQLQQFGLMDDTVVGLFYEDDKVQWTERTTVGYGAKQMGPYREYPGGPIKNTDDKKSPPTAAPPAQSPAPPPPPRTPAAPPADRDRDHAKPKKSGHSHPKPRRAKSAARQGSR